MTATGDEFWNDWNIPHPDGEDGYNFFHDPRDVLSQSVFGHDAFATSTTSSSSALGDSLSSIRSTSSSNQSPSLDVVEQWWSPASIEGDLGNRDELQQSSLSASPGLAEEEETFTAPAPMAGSLVSLNVWSPDPGCAPLSSPLPAPLPAPSQTILGDSSGRSGGLLYYAAMAVISATTSSSSSGKKHSRPQHHGVAHGALSGSLRSSLAAVVPIVAMSFVAATSW